MQSFYCEIFLHSVELPLQIVAITTDLTIWISCGNLRSHWYMQSGQADYPPLDDSALHDPAIVG